MNKTLFEKGRAVQWNQIEQIVVATGNPHKVSEIQAIMSALFPTASFVPLAQLYQGEEPEETGDTFVENARIKALHAQRVTGASCVIADDSGLCVDALEGAPGIYSARWSGIEGSRAEIDAANNKKLLAALASHVELSERRAAFCSSIVLCVGDECIEVEGRCEGTIALHAEGLNGFGYDPLFIPDAYPQKSMAELDPEEKNAISHRRMALNQLVNVIKDRFAFEV